MTILLSALPPSWRPFITTQTNLAGLSLLMLIGEILQEDIMWQSSVAPDAPTIPQAYYMSSRLQTIVDIPMDLEEVAPSLPVVALNRHSCLHPTHT